MKELIKNIILFLIIALPSLSCLLSVYLFSTTFIDYTYATLVFFGIIIILFNYNKTKYNYLISFVFSITLSFFTFFLSIVIILGINYILIQFFNFEELNKDEEFNFFIKKTYGIILVNIVSPILMFRSYRILFNIENNKYFKIIKFTAIILLIIYGLISKKIEKDYVIVWQVIMALSLQLILYKDEIIKLLNKNPVPNNK